MMALDLFLLGQLIQITTNSLGTDIKMHHQLFRGGKAALTE